MLLFINVLYLPLHLMHVNDRISSTSTSSTSTSIYFTSWSKSFRKIIKNYGLKYEKCTFNAEKTQSCFCQLLFAYLNLFRPREIIFSRPPRIEKARSFESFLSKKSKDSSFEHKNIFRRSIYKIFISLKLVLFSNIATTFEGKVLL